MPFFRYQAMDGQGKLQSGFRFGTSEVALAESLRKHQLLLVESRRMVRSRKLRLGQQHALFHEFASLVRAGISIGEALCLMELSEGPFQKLVRNWRNGVESGKSLTQLCQNSPECDGRIVAKMIQVGESTGALGHSLQQLADYFDSLNQLRKRVVSALLYPCVVFFVTVIAVIILTVYVIPMFMDMFQRYKVTLPLITRALIATTQFFRDYGVLAIAAMLLLLISLKIRGFLSSRFLFWILYKIPFLGAFISDFMHLTMLRCFSNLLDSDIRVHDALILLNGIYADPARNQAIAQIAEKVVKGDSLSVALRQSAMFPSKEIRMIQVGEETGKLAGQIRYLTEMYEKRIDYALSSFLALFEPLMIVALSCMIGVVLVGLYLPLFDILSGSGLAR